ISSLEHLAEVGRNLRLQVFDIRGCNDPAEFAHSSRYLLVNRTGCFHPQCLMRALLVVVLEPRPQGLPGFIQCLEVMTPDTLLFHSSDQSLNHPVLLRGVGTDGLLLQTVLVHRPSVMPRGKYQTVVTTQRDRILSPAQRAVPGNERLLQCCFSCLGVAAGAQ